MIQTTDTLTAQDFLPVEKEKLEAEELVRPSRSYWAGVFDRMKSNKVAVFSLFVIVLILLLSILGPIIGPSYETTDLAHVNESPSLSHWFGTDSSGRDLWSRVWIGARVSLLIGLFGALVPELFGILIGGISGYFGGWVDMVIMRIIDVGICIPTIVYVTLVMLVMESGPLAIIIAISLTGWMGTARMVRGRIMQFKSREFVLAAKTMGASSFRLIFKNILPNIMGQLVVNITSAIPSVIFTEAYLSFIGLGIKSPMTSLGQLSQVGITNYRLYPYQLFIPGIVISITVLMFYLFGNCLRDALDPRSEANK